MAFIPVDEFRPIGIVREYADLISAFDRQRRRRGMTTLDLDDRAGFYEGYTAHIFSWQSKTGKGLGPVSYPLILEALGLALAVLEIEPRQRSASYASTEQLELPMPVPARSRYTRKELTTRVPQSREPGAPAECADAA